MPESHSTENVDVSSLSWVIEEVRQSLQHSLTALKRVAEQTPSDAIKSIQLAQTHLHQAHGALKIIHLDGIDLLTKHCEQLVETFAAAPERCTPAMLALIEQVFEGLLDYLDDLLTGAPHQPIRLFPQYRELLTALDVTRINPSDLFFPETQFIHQDDDPHLPFDAAKVASARVTFERGLLKVLRNQEAKQGMAEMKRGIQRLRQMQNVPNARSFWSAMLGLMEVLHSQGVEVDLNVKRLCARVNLQMRRAIEGSGALAERLLKDALFYVAASHKTSPELEKLRHSYALTEADVPRDYQTFHYGRANSAALKKTKEFLNATRNSWDKLVAGRLPDIPQLVNAVEQLAQATNRLGDASLNQVVQALQAVAKYVKQKNTAPHSALALETATAILFLENALETFNRPSEQFAMRASLVHDRLSKVLAGKPLEESVEWLTELARQSHEHHTMSSLVGEIQTNLRAIEQTLDAFFRDPSKRDNLETIDNLLNQTSGALQLLDHKSAIAALEFGRTLIHRFGDSDAEPDKRDFERVAQTFGALGFYVDTLRQPDSTVRPTLEFDLQQDAYVARLIVDRRRHSLSQSLKALPEIVPTLQIASPSGTQLNASSVERETRGHIERAVSLFERLIQTPNDTTLIAQLRTEILEVRAGAELLDDTQWLATAQTALNAIDKNTEHSLLQEMPPLLTQLTNGQYNPAPVAVSEATLALAASDDTLIDAELLGIFLDEATEVFTTIKNALQESMQAPAELNHLTTLRRAFHTLKGSSRMVGLRQFGEAAWAVEQAFNLWLAEERAGTAALYELTKAASHLMAEWIKQIRSTHDPYVVNPASLIAAAEKVRAGQDFFLSAAQLDSFAASLESTEKTEAENVLLETHQSTDFPKIEFEPEPELELAVTTSATKQIGDLIISAQLFDIFLAEADNCLKVIKEEITQWGHVETARPASEKLIRAVHSLAGSSSTAGLTPVHDIAAFLEQQLIELEDQPVLPTDEEFKKLTVIAERLSALLHQFAAGVFPSVDREAMMLVDELRVSWQMRKNIPTEFILINNANALDDVAIARDADHFSFENLTIEKKELEVAKVPDDELVTIEEVEKINLNEAEEEAPVQDEIDAELLELFAQEANDLMPQIDNALRTLITQPNNPEPFNVVLRALHTLKGSARMAGALRLGRSFHEMETLAESAQQTPTQEIFENLQTQYDAAFHLFESLTNQESSPLSFTPTASSPASVLATPLTEAAALVESTPTVASSPTPPSLQSLVIPSLSSTKFLEERKTQNAAVVRVRSYVLDKLVNQAGEVSITRSRLDNDLSGVRNYLGDLTENIDRLRDQLREVEIAAEAQLQNRLEAQKEQVREFDPLEFDRFTRLQELTRMMAESVNDVAMLEQNISRGLENASQDLLNQERLTRDLQQDLMRVRMIPVESLADRLYRVVRQAAKETGKQVNLDIEGGNVEIDRSVLERMSGPFEHLLRNAVVHGIEAPQLRLQAGKNETGHLSLSVKQQGNEIVLEFSDDGAGLNLPRIRERALERGLLAPDAQVTDSQIADFIFTPGFSTATAVTELAGRGVGMDVVREAASALGGEILIASHTGQGSRFTIRLPLTLAVTQVVLIKAGQRIYALPAGLVQQVQHLRSALLATAYNEGALEMLGEKMDFAYLPLLLGDVETHPTTQRYSAVIGLQSGTRRLALHVDEVLGNREVVVKNIGPQLARMIGISGATILGTGEIVLIIDPTQFHGRVALPAAQHLSAINSTGAVGEIMTGSPAQTTTASMASAAVVMVVDDSVTVRRVTQRLLVREGYQVLLAKDGIEALEQLQDVRPDIVLADIEMPRMDGFDLTRNLRSDPRFNDIPIVMITSRTAEKHRRYALELGVNVYLGKPYNEAELLQTITHLISQHKLSDSNV